MLASSNGATRGLPGQEGASGTFRTQGWRVGLTPLVVAIDELGAIVASAQAKEKAELIALLTQMA